MSTLWVTSDPHFMHNHLAIDLRGFQTLEDHDQVLVYNYNSVIAKDDTVICTGDFSLKKPDVFAPILEKLNGHWHLVSGNHDACWPGHRDGYKFVKAYMDAGFESVQPFMRRKIDGNNILFSHFPYTGDHTELQRYTQYRLRNEGLTLIHGHTHSDEKISRAITTLQIHVGVDAWNLMPVSVDQIVEIVRKENA